MITSRFALMKVSPSQARPRMPMIAVMPDWQVLHFGTSATGALVTVRMTAATVSMTIAMAIGIVSERLFRRPGTVRSSGKMPASTTIATPARKMNALVLAPCFSGERSPRDQPCRVARVRPMRAAFDTRDRLSIPCRRGVARTPR